MRSSMVRSPGGSATSPPELPTSLDTLRVVDLVEPFGYRVRLEPPSTTPQDR